MVRVVSTKMLSRPHGAGALLDAAQAPSRRRPGPGSAATRQRGHLAGLASGIRGRARAGEDHAVVLDDGVVGDVALDLGAVALDQRAVLLEGLDQLQDAAHVVGVASRSSSSFSSITIVPMPSCT
jgi:hypothetical protein